MEVWNGRRADRGERVYIENRALRRKQRREKSGRNRNVSFVCSVSSFQSWVIVNLLPKVTLTEHLFLPE